MRSLFRGILVTGALLGAQPHGAGAQQQQGAPALPSLSADAQSALDALAPQFAAEVELRQGWFRDRPLLYYDFGTVAQPVAPGRVLWPIHGFDARGNPVAIRSQRPIFSTIPGLAGYSGVWRLSYVVTADHVQPNQLRSVADVEAIVRRNRAHIKETSVSLNLPLVARGSKLARDSVPGATGWYEGREVEFFDFGEASLAPVPLMVFAYGQDSAGKPNLLRDQASIADTLPASPAFPDLRSVELVHVDSAYVANSLKSAAAVRGSGYMVGPANSVRNCPVIFIDAAKIERAPSPLRAFADLRTPFPPAPTPPTASAPPPAPTPPQ